MHPFLHIGNLTLPMYGLCAMVGTVFALLAVFSLRKKGSPLSEDNLLDALIWAIFLGFVGAKVLYFITDPPTMPHSWTELWELVSMGLVFYGGLLGGLLGLLLVSKKTKKSFYTYTDLMAPCFCLAHAGGRVGCLMAGCCYGMACEGPFTVVLDGVRRLATQPMEAGFLVILSAVLTAIYFKKPNRGTVTGWYMTLYAVWRFIIEFFRADERGSVGPLSTSQFISLFIFAFGLYLLIRSAKAPNDFASPEAAPAGAPAEGAEAAPEGLEEVSEGAEEVSQASELNGDGADGGDFGGGPGDGGDQ